MTVRPKSNALYPAGATKVADHTLHGFTWTVMQDPEGNEFCVSDG